MRSTLALTTLFSGVLTLALVSPAGAEQMTGCLKLGGKSGNAKRWAIGEQPAKPCKEGKEQQVAIELVDGEGYETMPFYVTLDGNGAEEVIASFGPFEIFARCRLDIAGEDFAEIVVSSAEAGWFGFPEREVEARTLTPAEEGLLAIGYAVAGEEGAQQGGYGAYKFFAASPSGAFAVAMGTTRGLLNVFGHSCVLAGTLILIQEEP